MICVVCVNNGSHDFGQSVTRYKKMGVVIIGDIHVTILFVAVSTNIPRCGVVCRAIRPCHHGGGLPDNMAIRSRAVWRTTTMSLKASYPPRMQRSCVCGMIVSSRCKVFTEALILASRQFLFVCTNQYRRVKDGVQKNEMNRWCYFLQKIFVVLLVCGNRWVSSDKFKYY